MSFILFMLYSNTLAAAALALLAVVSRWLNRPAVTHALWLLVILKLLAPPVIHVFFPAALKPLPQSVFIADVAPPPDDGVKISAPAAATPRPPSAPNRAINPREVLLAAWLAGSSICALMILVRLLRFHGSLKHARLPSRAALAELARAADLLGIKRCPELVLLPASITPMLYCLGRRQRLILPESLLDRLDSDQRLTVLAHELAHLARRDHWVRWIETVATIVLWWHPLLWLARRQLHKAEELCCDAWVINALPDSRRSYATAIVDTLESTSAQPVACACGIGRLKDLQRRLTMIFSNTPPKAFSRLTRFVLVPLFLLLPIVPVRGADETPAEKDKKIAQLEERIKELESRLVAVEKMAGPTTANANLASREVRDAFIAKAHQRAKLDSKEYTPEQRREAEQLYQVASRNWRSPEAVASLKEMCQKYPTLNRTGCGLLYLGQFSEGEDREKYWKTAVEQHSDCMFFNGVQVGALGRYYLGCYYLEDKQPEKAKELFDQVQKDYPNAITHNGVLLSKAIEQQLAAATQPAKP